MEYIDSDEERRLEGVVDEEYLKLYEKLNLMRRSNKFYLDRTQANLSPPRESVPHRSSLRVRHKDLGLDAHTQQVRQAGQRAHGSQLFPTKDMLDCYQAALHLSQNRSDVIEEEEQNSEVDTDSGARPPALSND